MRHIRKKAVWITVIAIVVGNLLFSVAPVSDKESDLSITVLAARADGSGENDIPDPDDDIFPLRLLPEGCYGHARYYSRVLLESGKSCLTSKSLKRLGKPLAKENFLR